MRTRVRHWLHGLVAAFIGGGAAAFTATISANIIKPDSFNLTSSLHATLELIGCCFLVNGILNTFFYLKQSPLPPEPDEVTPLPINKPND